jgi:hypothetical protein
METSALPSAKGGRALFTRTPRGPSSIAKARVRYSSAHLEAPYGTPLPRITSAAEEVRLTIAPRPASAIARPIPCISGTARGC